MEVSRNIQDWFKEIAASSCLTTEIVPFSDPENKDWEITTSNISRKDKKYYKVILVKTSDGSKFWHKPMIQPFLFNGTYGILFLLKAGEKYLVQAKAEAGNDTPGHVILTPTVQSSYRSLKSGQVPYSYLIDELKNKLQFKSVPQDAGMLYHKNSQFIFAEIKEINFEILPNFFLASQEEITSLAKEGLVSEHLIQILGLLWLTGY